MRKLRMAYSIAGYGSKLFVDCCYCLDLVMGLSFFGLKELSVSSVGHLLILQWLVFAVPCSIVDVVMDQVLLECFKGYLKICWMAAIVLSFGTLCLWLLIRSMCLLLLLLSNRILLLVLANGKVLPFLKLLYVLDLALWCLLRHLLLYLNHIHAVH